MSKIIRLHQSWKDSLPSDINKYAKEHNIQPDYLVIWRWPETDGLVIAIDLATATCYVDLKNDPIAKLHTDYGWALDKIWPNISNILLEHDLICEPITPCSNTISLPDLGSP